MFVSYGIPERETRTGSIIRAATGRGGGGSLFRLLGAKDLGEKQSYRGRKMPAVNVGLLDGELAWRQHDGGHEDRSNMKYFIEWANGLMQRSGHR